ncbi:Histidine kinase-like ATPase domain-containing protein [Lentzea xinjiangensis]|uniref:Histidine kinase-like ATPase domain-containing protein n=1 Tax=Lentzea xinjiangensis TaxID=402600 RepID=A0A1H9JW59_9PSEU|nr:ATP-binding protein [Lentzea xinjiangensis]SEQ91078.1 Histidine kinase-like ATPase domain-containing protein [Lentzea xinjiangensis]
MTALVADLPVRPGLTMSALRRNLTSALTDIGEDHLYDVQLVVTELVTNVLDHAGGVGRLRILHGVAPCVVTIEVDDESSVEPVYGRSRLGENRGRGIVVVDNISREWGVRMRAAGKTVYALVDCTG